MHLKRIIFKYYRWCFDKRADDLTKYKLRSNLNTNICERKPTLINGAQYMSTIY